VKVTVVGLVTPHVLRVVDLAKEAETGVNVDWHLRDAVTKTVEDLGQQYNAPELLSAYVHGLETAAQDVGKGRFAYASALKSAAAQAARHAKDRH
jgi:hypothetical protein